MVKGVSKRILHVKTPGSTFAEAIFILKEDVKGVSEEEIIKEAESLAAGGVKKGKISKKTATNLFFSALGAVFVAVLWIISAMI